MFLVVITLRLISPHLDHTDAIGSSSPLKPVSVGRFSVVAGDHGGIVQASGNRRLLLCWNVLRDQIGLWLAQMQVRRENIARRTRQQTVVAHRQLLEVIRRGNAEEAATAARRHVAGWIELLPDCSRSPVLAGQADDGQGRPPSGVMARGAGRRKKA